MKVYVTGATGFVGTNLKRYLEDSTFEIKSIGKEQLTSISEINLDYNSTIIHLAGKAHDLKRISEPDEYYQVNYQLTKELYNAFLRSGACKFIFISSVKASADSVDDILSEMDVPNPKTYYGKSKLMAEEYIQSRALPEGKSYYILRPCMIHGPGNKGNLNLLYKLISKGIPYPLAAFENKRSFLSVENLCFVIRELLERDDIPSGIYNVADDEEVSTNELIELIGTATGKSVKLWKINCELVKLVAKFGDVFHLPLTTERLNKLTENYVVSNSKIKQALGKNFPFSSKEGILTTIRSFQHTAPIP